MLPVHFHNCFLLGMKWRGNYSIGMALPFGLCSVPFIFSSIADLIADCRSDLGYSAIFDHKWFIGEWSASQQPLSIACKELFPVVVSASLWGQQWATEQVEFCLDNMAVASNQHLGTLKDPNMMVLLHHLSLLAARHSFTFTAFHTASRDNSVADGPYLVLISSISAV